MELASINIDQRLYNIKCGTGYSCIGFEIAEARRKAVLEWIGHEYQPAMLGTQHAFDAYQEAMKLGAAHAERTRQRCEANLSPQLTGLEGRRVEVIDTEGDKPRRFKVGKSTGWMPCHLELANSRSRDGIGALMRYHSVRIIR